MKKKREKNVKKNSKNEWWKSKRKWWIIICSIIGCPWVMWLWDSSSQALHCIIAWNPMQLNTAKVGSETFYALSMSMSLNGNHTVHPAPTQFQTTVPSPITPQVLFTSIKLFSFFLFYSIPSCCKIISFHFFIQTYLIS